MSGERRISYLSHRSRRFVRGLLGWFQIAYAIAMKYTSVAERALGDGDLDAHGKLHVAREAPARPPVSLAPFSPAAAVAAIALKGLGRQAQTCDEAGAHQLVHEPQQPDKSKTTRAGHV